MVHANIYGITFFKNYGSNIMNGVISQTVEYEGTAFKVEKGIVYTHFFGTTITNHSMHWSWGKVVPKMGGSLEKFLLNYGYRPTRRKG